MRTALLAGCLFLLSGVAFPPESASSFQGLGDLPGGLFESVALGVSPDGRVVSGWSRSDHGDVTFRWESGAITPAPAETAQLEPRLVSADGRLRVGSAETAWGHEAMLWRDGQPRGLGGLSFDHEWFSRAHGVSADGEVVVGASDVEGLGSSAFLWTARHGMRALAEVLVADYGLDLTGWTLAEATAISDDGRTVVGFGQNPDGHTEGFLARLGDPVAPSRPSAHVFGRCEQTLSGFRQPSGAAFGPDGKIYVADRGRDRVVVHGPDGRVLRELNRAPGQPAHLRQPGGVAVAADGTVVVLDTGNDRVVIYSSAGEPLRAFGRFGRAADELHRPQGLAVAGGRIAVADSGNSRVRLFDLRGRPLPGLAEPAEPWHPIAVAFDGRGGLWVADDDGLRVRRFGVSGELRGSLDLVEAPAGLAWHRDALAVLASASAQVKVVEASGAELAQWGLPARLPREGGGRLHRPGSLAFSPGGERALVCEPGEGRCQLFLGGPEPPAHRPSHLPASWGEAMAVAGRFVAVARGELGAVEVYDLEAVGEPRKVATAGEAGCRFGQLRRISGVALDLARGRLWVSDAGGRRVSEYEPAEIFRPRPPSAGKSPRARFRRAFDASRDGMRPGALAVTASGAWFVVDQTQRAVKRFDGRGGWLTVAAEALALAVDEAAGELVVLAASGERVLRFDLEGRPRGTVAVPPARALAVAETGRIWLATEEGPLVAIDREGLQVARVGQADASPQEPLAAGVRQPTGVGVDARGRILALDGGNHRLLMFSATGDLLGAFGSGLYARPARLAAVAPQPLAPRAFSPPERLVAKPSFTVELFPGPEAMPAHERFALEVWVSLAEGGAVSEALALVVDATMPAHRHGMTTRPTVTPLGGGRFHVEGMLLHMAGEWELTFDLTRGGITERVELPLRLE